MGCKPKDLERALLSKELRTGSEIYTVYMDANKAANSRDTLAMLLYSRLFDWYASSMRVCAFCVFVTAFMYVRICVHICKCVPVCVSGVCAYVR